MLGFRGSCLCTWGNQPAQAKPPLALYRMLSLWETFVMRVCLDQPQSPLSSKHLWLLELLRLEVGVCPCTLRLTPKAAVLFFLLSNSDLLPRVCLPRSPGPCFFMAFNLSSSGSLSVSWTHVRMPCGPADVLSTYQVVTIINSFYHHSNPMAEWLSLSIPYFRWEN